MYAAYFFLFVLISDDEKIDDTFHPYEKDNLRQASDKLPLIDGDTRASLRIASLIFKLTSLHFTHWLMSARPQACSKLFF